MCGIVGYLGRSAASPVLLEGLKRLEYRGYDSAGVAILNPDNQLYLRKKTGRVDNLIQAMRGENAKGRLGISHTRWATHGGVTDANAHPHVSSDGMIVLVHNGVIENHNALRRHLEAEGFTFQTETDTEALANLIAYYFRQADRAEPVERRFLAAVRAGLRQVEGTYGIAAICTACPGHLIGARKGSPLILGVGQREFFIASDVAALGGRTQNVVYLEDGHLVALDAEDFQISTLEEEEVNPVVSTVDWRIEDAELGAYPHYMLKEIFEQPQALQNAMRGRFSQDESTAKFGGLNLDPMELRQVDRIVFVACGTAWHACLMAEHYIERYARIPVEVEYASEFRYRNAPLDKNTLVFCVSQSGETIDTLEAIREAKRKGYRILAITNGVGSTIAREVHGGIYQHAGPEIGVASTKAFTSQVLLAAMLGLYLGRLRDLSFTEGKEIVRSLRSVSGLISQILDQSDHLKDIAQRYARYNDFLFLGRQEFFPVALEGALKLKEISYIHAEGYPAAEMKHGPIALICEACPTVIIAMEGEVFPKVLANIQEIKARKGPVIVVTDAGSNFPAGLADEVIAIPRASAILQPLLATIPLQILAYYMALERGCDVDKPRNLAKSVTVE